jgi:hypothetical protein
MLGFGGKEPVRTEIGGHFCKKNEKAPDANITKLGGIRFLIF